MQQHTEGLVIRLCLVLDGVKVSKQPKQRCVWTVMQLAGASRMRVP